MTFNEALNKNQRRHLNKSRIELIWSTLTALDNTAPEDFDIWEELSIIVRDKDKYISDNMYDLLGGFYTVVHKKDFQKFQMYVQHYVDRIDIYTYLVAVRNIDAKYELPNFVRNLLSWLTSLFIALIVGNPIAGLDDNTGEVFVDEKNFCAIDLILGYCFYFAKSINFVPTMFNLIDKDIDFAHNMCNMFDPELLSYFNKVKKYSTRYKKQKENETIQDLTDYLLNVGCLDQLTFLKYNKFHPVDFLRGCMWSVRGQSSEILNSVDTFSYAVNVYSENIFLKRQRLLRDKGVRMVLNGTLDGIEYLDIQEVHNFKSDTHFLNVTSTFVDGAVRYMSFNLKNPFANMYLAFEVEVTLFFTIMCWLGLKDEMIKATDSIAMGGKHLNEDLTEEDLYNIKRLFREIVNDTEEMLQNSDLRYEDPKSWNYTGTTKFNKPKKHITVKKDGSYEWVVKEIGAYVRRLPAGQKASDEKIELARKYLIELPTGCTLVDGFSRKQKIRTE